MANAKKLHDALKQLQKVARGTTGWVSITRLAKSSGIPKADLTKHAEAMNLRVEKHGKYGMTATRKFLGLF